MAPLEFTVKSGIFSEKDISPVPGKKPPMTDLDPLFTDVRKVMIAEGDIIGMGEKRTPTTLTRVGYRSLTKKGGHPGFPKNLHGRIAEYCVMHTLSELHGLIKPGHHPNTGGKTPDFVYPYYIGADFVEVVTECKASGRPEPNHRKNRSELRDALVDQIGAYAMIPKTMRCVHCVNLQDRVIRNYWIGDMPKFQIRQTSTLIGIKALQFLRSKLRQQFLLTYFLAKWIDEEPSRFEEDAFLSRMRIDNDSQAKSIYKGLHQIDYSCVGIENELVVGPTPEGWFRLDEYRMLRPTSDDEWHD